MWWAVCNMSYLCLLFGPDGLAWFHTQGVEAVAVYAAGFRLDYVCALVDAAHNLVDAVGIVLAAPYYEHGSRLACPESVAVESGYAAA